MKRIADLNLVEGYYWLTPYTVIYRRDPVTRMSVPTDERCVEPVVVWVSNGNIFFHGDEQSQDVIEDQAQIFGPLYPRDAEKLGPLPIPTKAP